VLPISTRSPDLSSKCSLASLGTWYPSTRYRVPSSTALALPNTFDIGGGFPGNTGTEDYFSEIAAAVNKALDEHFPDDGKIRIIAEPGRYYVASAYTLATNVIASREMIDNETGDNKYMYYINDGVYGSFNCVLYDHYVPEPTFLSQVESNEKVTSSIWGPTCDGLDCIHSSIKIPKLNVEDWILWKNMGAYTISAAVEFNGLPFGKPIYFMSKSFWTSVKSAFQPIQKKISSTSSTFK